MGKQLVRQPFAARCWGSGVKFDFVDFGYSWTQERPDGTVSKEFHNSTCSLISQHLRKRDFRRKKLFLWMKAEGDAEVSETPGVVHVEAAFPFDSYAHSARAERLHIFSQWALATISTHAPDLMAPEEVEELLDRLVGAKFSYTRTEKVPVRPPGRGICTASFVHTPDYVECHISSAQLDGSINIDRGIFRPDEFDYAKGVLFCESDEEGFRATTTKGVFKSQ